MPTSSIDMPTPVLNLVDLVPHSLAKAGGQVIADLRKAWARELALMAAEKDAFIARLEKENADIRAAWLDALKELRSLAAESVASVKDGAPGPEGPPGPPGEPGKKGEPGEPGIGIASMERDGARLIFTLDDERRFDVGELPAGDKGDPGRDGIGVKDLMIDRDGVLIVTRDDGSMHRVGVVIGRDGIDGKNGEPGRDGRDGLSAEDFTAKSEDGGRFIALIGYRDGVPLKEFRIKTATPVFRGIWKDGEEYSEGDEVVLGGNTHIAIRDNPGRPHDADGWQLKQKRASDGASAYDIALREGFKGTRAQWLESLRGPPGRQGERGRDLTQLLPDGTKY